MDSPLRSDDGQASVEHVGLVALIAAFLVIATAVTAGASPAFRNSVRGGFEHALCVVSGQSCTSAEREPCPTLRTVKTKVQRFAVSYLRLGHDTVLAIERRSDGTYVMSLMEGTQSGVGIAAERGYGASSLSGEAMLVLGQRAGRTYEAATPQEARALVERLRRQQLPAVRSVVAGAADLAGLAKTDPSVSSYVLAGDGAVDALSRFGLGPVLVGGATYRDHGEIGVRIAAHAEEITAYVQMDARAGAFFEAMSEIAVPVGGRGAAAGGRGSKAGGPPGVDLTKSPRGAQDGPGPARSPRDSLTIKNPLAQKYEGEVISGGSLAMRFGPGPTLLGIEVVGALGTAGTRREIRARLDPADPGVRAAFEVWKADPGSATAIAGLGRAAREGAAIDVRTFKTKRTEHLHGGQAALGGHALGLGFGSQSSVEELVEQRSRPAGGEWEQRTDCVAAAAA